mmetsp:Transcript_3889/g.7991  ORF Transcript_3889/g.7991 Transcript_3889/m.7991 type:complete len:256 (+) Transcript_3889:28-795(+)
MALEVQNRGWLGSGRDQTEAGRYNNLRAARAWRVQSPVLWLKFAAKREEVRVFAKRFPRGCGERPSLWEKPQKAGTLLPVGKDLDPRVNEALLFHGTSPQLVLSILETGFNERFAGNSAGTAFGCGVYLADDAGKSDQYVSCDRKLDPSSEVHQAFYRGKQTPNGEKVEHPENVFYLFLCRAVLGFVVPYTSSPSVFQSAERKELIPIPGTSPRVHHHSLVVHPGSTVQRYREIVITHGERVYPEYLIAFKRDRI